MQQLISLPASLALPSVEPLRKNLLAFGKASRAFQYKKILLLEDKGGKRDAIFLDWEWEFERRSILPEERPFE